MSRIHSLLEKAWEFRFAGQLAEARETWAQAMAFLNDQASATSQKQTVLEKSAIAELTTMDARANSQNENLDGATLAQVKSDLFLLEVSFARSEMNLDLANQKLQGAHAALTQAGLPASFMLLFQSALCLDVQSKFADSMKLYQDCIRVAKTPHDHLAAWLNLTVCQFNLGLPHRQSLTKAQSLLDADPASPLRTRVEQLRVIDLKKQILDGDFTSIMTEPFADLTQGRYLQALWGSLPWASRAGTQAREAHIEALGRPDEFFQKDYRLQTLVHDPRLQQTGAATGFTYQVQVDRLFLWTFLWLDRPESPLRDLLARELDQFSFESVSLHFGHDDALMLESLGGWLSLCSSEFAKTFGEWRRKHLPLDPVPSAFFDLDRQVRERLSEPQAASPLSALIQTADPRFASYLQWAERFAQKKNQVVPSLNRNLVVNRTHQSLKWGSERLVSPPGCELIAALKRTESLSFEEAMKIAFQIAGYDSDVHAPKINNLLQRLKKLIPEGAKLWTKHQRIYLEDPALLILIDEGSAFERFFPSTALSVANFGKAQTVQLMRRQEVTLQARLIEIMSQKQTRSRLEIQAELGLSRASSHRMIQHWIQKKILVRQGQGRQAHYRLAKN